MFYFQTGEHDTESRIFEVQIRRGSISGQERILPPQEQKLGRFRNLECKFYRNYTKYILFYIVIYYELSTIDIIAITMH